MSPAMGTVYLPGTRVIALDPFKSDSKAAPVVVSCAVQVRTTATASFCSVLSSLSLCPRVTLPADSCCDRRRAER